MIYYDGLESMIEAVYLGEDITGKQSGCSLFVNPYTVNPDYLIRKTIIINTCDYSESRIKTFLDNGNTVISRVYYDIPGVEYCPYILNLNMAIRWNGMFVEHASDYESIVELNMASFNEDEGVLYFPKIRFVTDRMELMDRHKNFTALGWALQQVGINIRTNTPFTDMDLIKMGKK